MKMKMTFSLGVSSFVDSGDSKTNNECEKSGSSGEWYDVTSFLQFAAAQFFLTVPFTFHCLLNFILLGCFV